MLSANAYNSAFNISSEWKMFNGTVDNIIKKML